MKMFFILLVGLQLFAVKAQVSGDFELGDYKGALIGDLVTRSNDVTGTLYALGPNLLYLDNFNFDGANGFSFFYIGCRRVGTEPNKEGIQLHHSKQNDFMPVGTAVNQGLLIPFPFRKHISVDHFGWFSLWDEQNEVSLADISIPEDFEEPRPYVLSTAAFTSEDAQVNAAQIILRTARIVTIQSFTFDGTGLDANFYAGTGDSLTATNGELVTVEEENDSTLGNYERARVTLRLPEDLTLLDADWIIVTCPQCTKPFAQIELPGYRNLPADVEIF
ncbi:unnamed protein product [Owenia fusiformis]|uniref:DM13 domain-containing protein n=1 Tax=Owenia fusiformis TaxID=6347 RepID=A0A8S4PCH4_OWEFU|nr:unnamed protein product [Owenia fusiformis]